MSQPAEDITACEIDCTLISRGDERHCSICNRLSDVACPTLISNPAEDSGGIDGGTKNESLGSHMWELFVRFIASWVLPDYLRIRIQSSTQRRAINNSPDTLSSKSEKKELAHCIAWHPLKKLIAVAFRDNSIRLYNVYHRKWECPRLEHAFQRNVQALAWRPNAPNTLAAACLGGICIWRITQVEKGRSAWLRFLKDPAGPVLSICWSPCGKWLASCAAGEDVVRVWVPELSSADPKASISDCLYLCSSLSPLQMAAKICGALPKGTHATGLSWSPNGNYLVAATASRAVFIWEARTWRSELWQLEEGESCGRVSWSADSSYVMLAPRRDPSARSGHRHLHSRPVCMLSLSASPPRIDAALDICKVDVTGFGGGGNAMADTGIAASQIGGQGVQIREVALDRTRERFAVSFEGPGSRIALFTTSLAQAGDGVPPRFLRRQVIVGPYGDTHYPVTMSFCPHFERGALLCVCWSNGHLSFYPMLFTPAQQ